MDHEGCFTLLFSFKKFQTSINTRVQRSLGYDDDAVFNVWANSESDPSSLFRPEGRIDYKSMKSKILEAIMNDYDDIDCLSENNVF